MTVWSTRMNYPLYSAALFPFICQAPSFKLGLKRIANSARWPHWNQWAAGGCSWEQDAVSGAGCPDHLHWHNKPPLSLFLFQIRRRTAAPCAPCVNVGVLLATASMQVVWPAGFRQPAHGWARHTGSTAPLPAGRLPTLKRNRSVSRMTRDCIATFFNVKHQENPVRY